MWKSNDDALERQLTRLSVFDESGMRLKNPLFLQIAPLRSVKIFLSWLKCLHNAPLSQLMLFTCTHFKYLDLFLSAIHDFAAEL